jgi:hypothetical protein
VKPFDLRSCFVISEGERERVHAAAFKEGGATFSWKKEFMARGRVGHGDASS